MPIHTDHSQPKITMRVLIIGGSGSIGEAVLHVLVAQGNTVFALCRTPETVAMAKKAGATPVMGDIRQPYEWTRCLQAMDAVVYAASTWDDDMDAVDNAVVTTLLDGLKTTDSSKALIYTGGCWHYGTTGSTVATEKTSFSPISSFSESIGLMNTVLSQPNVRGMVIHPAMVYEHRGGVFERMYADIENLGYVRIFGHRKVHWPLVHRVDLAQLYSLMLQHGKAGDVFNASANDGVAVGDIANAISTSVGCVREPVVVDVSNAV